MKEGMQVGKVLVRKDLHSKHDLDYPISLCCLKYLELEMKDFPHQLHY